MVLARRQAVRYGAVVATKGPRPSQDRQAVAAGMAAARERGVRLGRPEAAVPDSGRRIQQLRDEGLSLSAIAGALNSEGVASPSGRAWTKSSVQYVLRRMESRGDSAG